MSFASESGCYRSSDVGKGWMALGCLGLFVAGCGPESRPVDSGAEGGHGFPAEDEGAPCESEVGCAIGLSCSEGACVACGTGTPAPGKLCFGTPTLVSDRSARLVVAHLPTGVAILADRREVHVRMLFRDGAGSLREQWFPAARERSEGELLDLDGDGFDEFMSCDRHWIGHCEIVSFGPDALVPFATVDAWRSEIDGVGPHGDSVGRVFSVASDDGGWSSWLLNPGGVVEGNPLPVRPSDPLLAGDFDDDGVPDLAAPVDDRLVMLALDEAGDDYAVMASIPIPLDSTLVAVTNLDDEPRDELLFTTPADQLVVARLDTSGVIVLSEPIPLARQTGALGIGDVDGDGRVDIVDRDTTTAPPEGEQPEFDRIRVLAQTSPGTFERRHLPSPGPIRSLAVFDVDADGYQDLVVSTESGIHQMLADP